MVTVLNSGRTRDPVLAQCLREIWFATAMGQFELQAVHLALTENRVADYLSRWHLSALYREYLIDSQLLADLQEDHLPPAIFDFVVNI